MPAGCCIWIEVSHVYCQDTNEPGDKRPTYPQLDKALALSIRGDQHLVDNAGLAVAESDGSVLLGVTLRRSLAVVHEWRRLADDDVLAAHTRPRRRYPVIV
jgi:hypothetical protein